MTNFTFFFYLFSDKRVSENTVMLLHHLLMLDTTKRATAQDALIQLQSTVSNW